MSEKERILTLTHNLSQDNTQFWPCELVGIETYSDPGIFNLIVLSSKQDLDVHVWLGRCLQLTIKNNQPHMRYFSLNISIIRALDKTLNNHQYYHFTLSSWLQFANIATHTRTFYQQRINEILDTVFKNYALVRMNVHIEYPMIFQNIDTIDFIVQYNETDLAFITRVLDSYGFYYWLEFTKNEQIMRFGPRTYTPNMFDLYPYSINSTNKYVQQSSYNYRKQVANLIWPDGLAHSNYQVLISASFVYSTIVTKISHAYYHYTKAPHVYYNHYHFNYTSTQSKVCECYYYPSVKPLLAYVGSVQQRQIQLYFRSRVITIGLGQSVTITEQKTSSSNDNLIYVPINVVHKVRDVSEWPDTEMITAYSLLEHDWTSFISHYENEITALPIKNTPYYPPIQNKHIKLNGFHTCFIVGPIAGEVYTDKLGRVKIWFSWDENNPQANPDYCPWVRVMQAMAHSQAGHQFIPRVGDEVVIKCVNGDISQSVVIGSHYNAHSHQSLSNQLAKSNIAIKSPYHQLLITHKQKQGNIEFSTLGDLAEITNSHLICNIAGSQSITVNKNVTYSVVKGRHTISANKLVCLKVGSSMIEITPQQINMIGVNIHHQAHGKHLAASLSVIGSTHKCPLIHSSGDPHQGGTIKQGSGSVFINGVAVARQGDITQCHGAMGYIAEGHSNIYINTKSAACKGFATSHGGAITSGASTVSAVYNQQSPINKQSLAQEHVIGLSFLFKQCTQFVIKNTQFTLTYLTQEGDQKRRSISIDPVDPSTLVAELYPGEVVCSLKPYHRQCDIITVNDNYFLPYYKTTLKVPSGANKGDCLDKDHQFNVGVIWPMIVHDIRYEDRKFSNKLLNTSVSMSPQEERFNYHQVTPQDIEYFKSNGNNVTIFIHGFNVKIGQFTEQIASIEDNQSSGNLYLEEPGTAKGCSLIRSNHPATIYRDSRTISNQCNSKITADVIVADRQGNLYVDSINGRWYLNGTGARNWAINVEYNLNKAAANFSLLDAKSYESYTRIIHVTWSGDPAATIDYISAVDQAFDAAKELAQLLTELKDHGLEVNVIAHSLGNAVLVKAMDLLAHDKAVDHVFLWEAAIPCDVFARPHTKKTIKDKWYMPNAIDGAQQITVLYSLNDNILGPILAQQSGHLSQTAINRSKPFLIELVPAYLTTALGFGSLYYFAMWFGVPISSLWKFSCQQQLYKQWWNGLDCKYRAPHNLTHEQKTRQVKLKYHFMLPTLSEQIKYYSASYTKFYKQLEKKLDHAAPYLQKVFSDVGWGTKSLWQQQLYNEIFSLAETVFEYPTELITVGQLLIAIADASIQANHQLTVNLGLTYIDESARNVLLGAACLIDIMEKLKVKPVNALGYSGPDDRTSKLYGDKIHVVTQTNCLWSHSGMKIPSDFMQKHVYKQTIFNYKNGINKFGKYKCNE